MYLYRFALPTPKPRPLYLERHVPLISCEGGWRRNVVHEDPGFFPANREVLFRWSGVPRRWPSRHRSFQCLGHRYNTPRVIYSGLQSLPVTASSLHQGILKVLDAMGCIRGTHHRVSRDIICVSILTWLTSPLNSIRANPTRNQVVRNLKTEICRECKAPPVPNATLSSGYEKLINTQLGCSNGKSAAKRCVQSRLQVRQSASQLL